MDYELALGPNDGSDSTDGLRRLNLRYQTLQLIAHLVQIQLSLLEGAHNLLWSHVDESATLQIHFAPQKFPLASAVRDRRSKRGWRRRCGCTGLASRGAKQDDATDRAI